MPTTSQRPNIVLILADDMGYSDLGCYGSEIRTPNLDGLAAEGLRFSQMYNFARCCPSRAALLTGLYPHQAGIGHMAGGIPNAPGYGGYLRHSAVTIAQVLKERGYRTLMSGKWHCGKRPDSTDIPPRCNTASTASLALVETAATLAGAPALSMANLSPQIPPTSTSPTPSPTTPLTSSLKVPTNPFSCT